MSVLSDFLAWLDQPLFPPKTYTPPRETPQQQADRIEAEQKIARSKAYMDALAEDFQRKKRSAQ